MPQDIDFSQDFHYLMGDIFESVGPGTSLRPRKYPAHPIERALERYGMVLTQDDVEYLEGRIKNRDNVTYIQRTRKGLLWEVKHKIYLYPVTDNKGAIKTFYPLDDTRIRGFLRENRC